MIPKRIPPANDMGRTRATIAESHARQSMRQSPRRAPRPLAKKWPGFALWPLAGTLLLCLLAAPPRAAAQSAGLAQMPPPPSEWKPASSTPSGAGAGSSSAAGGESSSRAGGGESSSKPDDYSDDSDASGAPDNPAGRPSLRRRDGGAGDPIQPELVPNGFNGGPAVPEQPAFDPLHAQRDLDVGEFYFKKGQYDAAIDRYQEATKLNPKMAKPYLLMGEVYEKQNHTAEALTAYRKYLDMYNDAPDRDKVQKRIDKLQEKTGGRGAGTAGRSG